ncbi:hypothetical protein C4K08_4613 [Pseudomonas chlororaphis subsp. aureofaciens]|nr:hypothetical protein C4K08_4613 [Pseudomonas chlororaphis subsp. aureofaciens]
MAMPLLIVQHLRTAPSPSPEWLQEGKAQLHFFATSTSIGS